MLLVAATQRTIRRGPCNITAMLLNEVFGGEILNTPLADGDHSYIHIDGRRIDFTESQFAAPVNYLDMASDRMRGACWHVCLQLGSPVNDSLRTSHAERVAAAPSRRRVCVRRCVRVGSGREDV